MVVGKINLRKHYNLCFDACLEYMIPICSDGKIEDKPGLLIVPGGGYAFLSNREADPIALAFMLKGYNCFILRHAIKSDLPNRILYPEPQLDIIAAIDYIKKRFKKFHLTKLFGIGFSAGAHALGSSCSLFKDAVLLNMLPNVNPANLRFEGICLAYPVITMHNFTHGGSKTNLLGADEKLINKLSIENNIKKDFPPCFIWTTKDDTCVSYENSLMLKESLDKLSIKNELIIFEKGDHGLSLGSELVCPINHPEIVGWVDKCDDFFKYDLIGLIPKI